MRSPSQSITELIDLSRVDPNELVRRAQSGCNDSATELSNRFLPRLILLLEKRLRGNRSDAEDVAQESLAKAFQQIDRFDFNYRFSTWLYTIAIRRAIDFARKEKRALRVEGSAILEDIPSPRVSDSATATDTQDNIWSVARRILVESHYSVLWLKYGEGMSVEEIAKVLHKSKIGVRVILHRARNKLSTELHRRDRELSNHPFVSKTSPT